MATAEDPDPDPGRVRGPAGPSRPGSRSDPASGPASGPATGPESKPASGSASVGGEVLVVSSTCTIALSEIEWRFSPSGGPGGQHANRSHTRAEASFDVAASASLGEAQRRRLLGRLGSPVVVGADDTRSQSRNRALALERLRAKLAAALVVERPRRPTRPSKAAKQRRLDAKKRRGDTKRGRGRPHHDDS